MIHGWFMEVPSRSGRDGTSIPESGMAGCTRRTESASESAPTEDTGGAGIIGDLTGVTGP